MGCACDQERTKEEVGSKVSLARVVQLAKETKGRTKHHKQRTDMGARQLVMETIRVLSEPVSISYRVEAVVKEDAESRLMQVEYQGTKQPCFLKAIKKHKGRDLLHQKAKLSSQSERVSKLDHPYVLQTYEVFQDEEHFYAAMETFAGHIAEFLSDPWSHEEHYLAKVMYQVFRGLNYCHQQGIIHGRMSMASIAMQERPGRELVRVKLSGFTEFDSSPVDVYTEDLAEYRAPEIENGYNEKCDIWSCGIILSKMLSDQAPLSGSKTTLTRKKSAIVFNSSVWREKSEEVVALIASMLHESPQGRPSAGQCLMHPWIQKHTRPALVKTGMLNSCLANLRTLRFRNPLQEGVLKFVVKRAFKAKDFEPFLEAFFMLDKDLDGVFSEEEVRSNFFRTLSEGEALKATKRVMKAVEHNSGGAISFSEFLVACFSEKKLLSESYLREAFRCFDRDRGGHVLVSDLKSQFLQSPTAEKERQWRQLFLQASNQDDIDFSQFMSILSHSE